MRHNPSKARKRALRGTDVFDTPAKAPENITHYMGGLGQMLLNGLQSKPMYQGTADPAAVAARRAKNKVARTTRRGAR